MFLTHFQEAQPTGGFRCSLGQDMAGHSNCPHTPSLWAGSASQNICLRDHCQDRACFVNHRDHAGTRKSVTETWLKGPLGRRSFVTPPLCFLLLFHLFTFSFIPPSLHLSVCPCPTHS